MAANQIEEMADDQPTLEAAPNYDLPFTLQRAATVTIVHRIVHQIFANVQMNNRPFSAILNVFLCIRTLSLPARIEASLEEIVEPTWEQYMSAVYGICDVINIEPINEFANCVYFTPLGTLDFKRTAEAWVALNHPLISDDRKYYLARFFCLDQDKIVEIWNRLEEEQKLDLRNMNVLGMGSPEERLYAHHFNFFEDYSDFQCALMDRNEAALRHFRTEGTPSPFPDLEATLRLNWITVIDEDFSAGVFQFLMSRYPTDGALLRRTLGALPELNSGLTYWPYEGIFADLLDTEVPTS